MRTFAVSLAALVALAALPALATAPVPDADFALDCLKHRPEVTTAASAAVRLTDGTKTWGICIVKESAGARTESWWRRDGKHWRYLGTTAIGAAGSVVQKRFGIPARDADVLTKMVAKNSPR